MANGDTKSGFFSKGNDLKNRIIFTILMLSVYRLGTYIPLPGIDTQSLQAGSCGTHKMKGDTKWNGSGMMDAFKHPLKEWDCRKGLKLWWKI